MALFSTALTSVETNILDHHFIPENIRQLIFRRTENGKTFGKLEITAPAAPNIAETSPPPPRNIVACFLLDTSGSMEGEKHKQSINTIKQFAQIFHEERNGKTLTHQPIHAWICVISFNSVSEVIVPFQEITEETLPTIFSHLDHVLIGGSTNYESAFLKQKKVIGDIIEVLAADPAQRKFHIIRFFETDGEITQGTNNIHMLYTLMRQTTGTAAQQEQQQLNFTFEDYVIGYGKDVDLKCLKQLASPTPPPLSLPLPLSSGQGFYRSTGAATAATAATATNEYNCSSIITVVRPEDIGWQVGEILFKVIMRLAFKMKVSVASKDPAAGVAELFEYQTHQWSNETTFHSVIHNERKALYIQYTPAADNTTASAATATAASTAPSPEIIVSIQCENQFTGTKYKYEFLHQALSQSTFTTPLLLQPDDESITSAKKTVFPIIQGMIQIEIFKQLRELEANSNKKYSKDVIVREAYKTMRMLKAIETNADFPQSSSSSSSITSKTANLITDVKLIIGLTAVNDINEQRCIIHARRTASAEEDIFNAGADISRKYVENEEDYEDVASEVIQKRDGKKPLPHNDNDDQHDDDDDDDDYNDSIPSRIATCMTPSRHQRHHHTKKPSILRLLCARIALSKIKNQDRSPETIYSEMKKESLHYGGHYDEDPSYHYTSTSTQDNTFSTPSQDDEYTQRRMGMMRQMSTPSSSSL
jgi:uncharacterized protein YegL